MDRLKERWAISNRCWPISGQTSPFSASAWGCRPCSKAARNRLGCRACRSSPARSAALTRPAPVGAADRLERRQPPPGLTAFHRLPGGKALFRPLLPGHGRRGQPRLGPDHHRLRRGVRQRRAERQCGRLPVPPGKKRRRRSQHPEELPGRRDSLPPAGPPVSRPTSRPTWPNGSSPAWMCGPTMPATWW